MNIWMLMQLALYEIFDIVPFVVLCAAPFQNRISSKKSVVYFAAVLYLMGLLRRSITFLFPSATIVFSILWAFLYLAVYYFVVRETLPKLLFVLITVLGYASFTAILYSYLGYHIFSGQLQQYPYCIEASVCIVLTMAVTFPPMFYWLTKKAAPLLADQENNHIFKTLWFVPAIFCVLFYYNLYTSGSILDYASSTRNLVFSMAISIGSFFVLSLVLRYVKVSALSSRLKAEKHQLELHALQYKRLSDRMEEARRVRHDLRQFINVLQVYLANGDTSLLHSYIEKICTSLPIDTQVVYCLHPSLNALLSFYAELAVTHHIAFTAQVDFPENPGVQDTDLVVLLGNLLENSDEACCRQTASDRLIRLKIHTAGRQIIITLDNSYEGTICRKDGCFSSAKRPGCGIGLASIRQIAEKYNGVADFYYDEATFYSSVMLVRRDDIS